MSCHVSHSRTHSFNKHSCEVCYAWVRDTVLDNTHEPWCLETCSPLGRNNHHTSNFSATVTVHATDKCILSYEIVNRVLTRTVTVYATEECTLSYEIVNRVPKEDWRPRITCLRKSHLQADLRATPSLLCSSIIAKSWPHILSFAHLFHLLLILWPLLEVPCVGTVSVLTSAKAALKSVRQSHDF